MNMSCGSRVIKHIMLVFNFLFVITGIVILAVGVSVKTYYYPYDTLLDDKYFSLPNMLIATGSFIFIISFVGCYGAMKESWVLLMVFSVLLTVIFIFELSVGIAGYVLRDKTSYFVRSELLNSMPKYASSPSISNMWDLIQEEFECCGVNNYTDWETIFNTEYLPVSCCPRTTGVVGAFYCNANGGGDNNTSTTIITTISTKTTKSEMTEASTTEASTTEATTTEATTTKEPTKETTTTTTITSPPEIMSINEYPPSSSDPYKTGCQSAFGNFVKKNAVKIGGVGIAFAMIQLVGIGLSFHLARQLKNGYYST